MSKADDVLAAQAALDAALAEAGDASMPATDAVPPSAVPVTLDRSRAFATYFPHGGRARFNQDGKDFDFAGNQVFPE